MKTAYVTGGTGCVGRNLIEELSKDGWTILAAHRESSDTSRLDGVDVQLVEVDLHDPESVLRSMPEGISAVFHVAASTSHWSGDAKEQWKDNVLATRNLGQAALAKKVQRFIFTSTGATNDVDAKTRGEAEKIWNQYVRTKRQSEIELEELEDQGLDVVYILPAIVVGKYDYNSYSQLFQSIYDENLPGVFPGVIEFCNAADIARAQISAFEKGKSGERYTLGGPSASWLEFCQMVAKTLGKKPPSRVTPIWLLSLIGHISQFIAVFTGQRPMLTPQLARLLGQGGKTDPAWEVQAREELGYEPSSLQQMIDDCCQWMLAEGLIGKS